MLYFLFFILGAFTFNLFQILLSIIKGYEIFKFVEQYSLMLMVELEVYRHQSLQILKLCYEEAEKEEEYSKVESKIHQKFNLFQESILERIKNRIPYSLQYSNLEEFKKVIEEKKDE